MVHGLLDRLIRSTLRKKTVEATLFKVNAGSLAVVSAVEDGARFDAEKQSK